MMPTRLWARFSADETRSLWETGGAISTRSWLLANTKSGENAAQDIVGRGDAGDGVNGLQCAVEIEEQ